MELDMNTTHKDLIVSDLSIQYSKKGFPDQWLLMMKKTAERTTVTEFLSLTK